MNLHNTYGYGQLFCFSGLEGETSRNDDFVGMFMEEPVTVRFHFDFAITLRLPFQKEVAFRAVLGDTLDGEGVLMAFVDRRTVVGFSEVEPIVEAEGKVLRSKKGNVERIETESGVFYLTVEKGEGMYAFTFSYGVENTVLWTKEKLEKLKAERYAYFERMPKCKDEKYEKLYYKCLSINKENVYSPEGKIPCLWTTPDRVPHRFMWLWDSVFHAMAFAEYNIEMAKNCIRSILAMEEENGFIAHMQSPQGAISEITQPQVLAWGVWSVYQKDKDKAFLEECVPALKKFLLWTMENRDKNHNGLLEWLTEFDYTECKCGESGLDNSPRFDFDVEMDAVDFSTYLSSDAKYLSMIYAELGDKENSEYFNDLHERTKQKINELLWHDEDGLYYDRLFDGKLTRVATPFSFWPMFAGLCSQEQADKMVKVLLDENRFWTALPVPTMPKDSEFFETDMWRGCSWLNINYFIMRGLQKYGYTKVAEELRERTLSTVYKWYQKTGNIFEFYDADDKICPFHLNRKGPQPEKYDYRVHVHSITDYNWSACFTILLLQGIEV